MPVQTGAATVASESDLEVMLQAVESVPPMPASSLPSAGTFWSAQHAPGSAEEWPPLPISLGMGAWSLGNDGVYLLDDLNHVYGQPKKSKSVTTFHGGPWNLFYLYVSYCRKKVELVDVDDQPLVSHHSFRHFARNLCCKEIARQETGFNPKRRPLKNRICDWEADNVPVSATGTATFDVEIYVGDPVDVGSQIFSMAQAAQVVIASYQKSYAANSTYLDSCEGSGPSVFDDETEHWVSGDGSDYGNGTSWDGECSDPVYYSSGTDDLSSRLFRRHEQVFPV
jgi:hypothetical protein